MDVEGHHRVRSAGLEEPRDIFGRDRVARLRSAGVRIDEATALGEGPL